VAQIDVALNTGMRKSEQFGLTWNRVYLDKRFVFLDTAKNVIAATCSLTNARRLLSCS